MEIKDIKYFVCISQHKSFSKAAKILYISQQALSASIKNLEAELGTQLFNRISSGVDLTEHGMFLLGKFQALLSQYDKMIDEINTELGINQGTILLGITPGVLCSLSSDLLISFSENYPHINVKKDECLDITCKKKILSEELDLGLGVKSDEVVNFNFISLKQEPLVLLVHKNHPLAVKSSIKLIDLKNENFIFYDESYEMHHYLISKCIEAGFKPNIVFQTWETAVVTSLVNMNKGVHISPKYICTNLNQDNIIAIPFVDKSFYWEIGFIYKKDKTFSKPIELFINFILQSYTQSSNTFIA